MFEVLHRFNYLFKRVFIHLIFHFFFSFDNLSSFIQTFFFLLSFFSFFFYIRYFLLLLLSVILKLVFIFIFVFFLTSAFGLMGLSIVMKPEHLLSVLVYFLTFCARQETMQPNQRAAIVWIAALAGQTIGRNGNDVWPRHLLTANHTYTSGRNDGRLAMKPSALNK